MFVFISVAVKRYGNEYGYVFISWALLRHLAKNYSGIINILEEENLIKINHHGRDKKTGINRGSAFGLVEDVGTGGNTSEYFIKLSKGGAKEYTSFIKSINHNHYTYYNNITTVPSKHMSINRISTFSHNELSDSQLNIIIGAPFEERYRYLEYTTAKGSHYNPEPAKHKSHDSRYYHWLHSMHSRERHFVLFNGSPLIENFDVTGCFYTLIAKLIMEQGGIPKDEQDKYNNLVRYGDIYEEIRG